MKPLTPDEYRIVPETGYTAGDRNRPQPRVVSPGARDFNPPSDAIVLFDGTNLDAWKNRDGTPPAWKIQDGYTEVVPKSGNIWSRESFGDIQLHLEFASPLEIEGDGQGRGNSGIFFMDTYEVQILDSFENPTYPDGTVGAVYNQWPPLVNPIRKPGEWNTFEITFTAPVFEGHKLLEPAFITVFLNGIVIHNHAKILGGTRMRTGDLPHYASHEPKGPIQLQDHNNPVRFRNIWVRELDLKPLGEVA
ncbi:MAG: DUF1080 domain-containing protein [Verrucomicrobiota bacterium]